MNDVLTHTTLYEHGLPPTTTPHRVWGRLNCPAHLRDSRVETNVVRYCRMKRSILNVTVTNIILLTITTDNQVGYTASDVDYSRRGKKGFRLATVKL